MADSLLRHVGQDGIGTTKSDHRHLAEEHALLNIDVAGAKPAIKKRDRGQPQNGADKRRPQGAAAGRCCAMARNATIDDAVLVGIIGPVTLAIGGHPP